MKSSVLKSIVGRTLTFADDSTVDVGPDVFVKLDGQSSLLELLLPGDLVEQHEQPDGKLAVLKVQGIERPRVLSPLEEAQQAAQGHASRAGMALSNLQAAHEALLSGLSLAYSFLIGAPDEDIEKAIRRTIAQIETVLIAGGRQVDVDRFRAGHEQVMASLRPTETVEDVLVQQ